MIKRISIIILAMSLILQSTAFSAPPFMGKRQGPEDMTGEALPSRLMKGMLKAQKLGAPAVYPATVKILFLRVDFQPDTAPLTTGTGVWNDPAYSVGGDPDYWMVSDKNNFISYYNEVSYGLLTVQVTVSNSVYRLPNTMSSYGADSYASIENFIYDSVTAADSAVDFSLYDAILIVHAGAGEEADVNNDTPNDLWSLYYADPSGITLNDNISGTKLFADGRQITEAIIMPQTDSQDTYTIDPLGVYLHEFGHWLGLPDLYCTGGIFCPEGVGKWSLMDSGSYNKVNQSDPYGSSPSHLDAWSKVYLGWVTPQTPQTSPDPGLLGITDVETNKSIMKLSASPSNSSLYFLVENRRKKGYDSGLPGEGLLVWHIDDQTVNNGLSSNSVNNNKYHMGVMLVEADGDFALTDYNSQIDIGNAGDPFPGTTNNTSYTPQTYPSTRTFDSSAWVNLTSISPSSDNMSFVLGFSPEYPAGLVGNLTGATVNLSWSAVTAADFSVYKIYRNSSLLNSTTGTSYADSSALLPADYHYQVTAVDANGYESRLSDTVTVTVSAISNGTTGGTSAGSNGKGSINCFIATAAYGGAFAPEVDTLRRFRDEHLLPNAVGRAFVKAYYTFSPPIADYIAERPMARRVVRGALSPIVLMIKYPLSFAGLTLLAGCLVYVRRRKVRAEKT